MRLAQNFRNQKFRSTLTVLGRWRAALLARLLGTSATRAARLGDKRQGPRPRRGHGVAAGGVPLGRAGERLDLGTRRSGRRRSRSESDAASCVAASGAPGVGFRTAALPGSRLGSLAAAVLPSQAGAP